MEKIDGSNGNISGTGKTLAIAQSRLNEKLKTVNQGLPYVDKDWTVGEYLDYWMNEIQIGKIRETTISTYRRMIKNHIVPTLGCHKLKKLSVIHIRLALNELKKRGRSGATLQKYLIILNACLNCALREEIIYRNVAHLVEKPKYTPRETAIWSAEQAVHFLLTAKAHPLFIAFLLLLTYGMRRGEVLGLRWCDIDFNNGWIHVRQQIDRIDGTMMARELKTKNSRRNLPLRPVVRTAMLHHAKKNGITIPQFNPYLELSLQGTIVVSKANTPLEPRNLARCFHLLTKKAGLPRIKLHATRHTTATILKELKTDIKDAQLLLGHSNVTTTLNIYQHGTPENQRNIV